MKIAILSDIHDNIWNLRLVLDLITNTDALIFCGDLCSPFVMGMLANGYKAPIHLVFGNNDGDQYRITQIASAFDHVHLYGEFAEIDIDGRTFAVTHYPELAGRLATGDVYDVVCYGHNHTFKVEREGSTLLVNPGCVMGYDPGAGTDVKASFIVYDSSAHKVEGYQL